MLVQDLTEVVNRVTAISRTSIGEPEPFGRITWIRGAANAVWHLSSHITNSVQRKENVAATSGERIDINLRRVCLIEYVEETGSELELRLLCNAEILKEGDVEVATTRSADVERRL